MLLLIFYDNNERLIANLRMEFPKLNETYSILPHFLSVNQSHRAMTVTVALPQTQVCHLK